MLRLARNLNLAMDAGRAIAVTWPGNAVQWIQRCHPISRRALFNRLPVRVRLREFEAIEIEAS